ncbi:MAG: hypothetical protein AB7L94_29935 [Kofleriaceae bacterium]
MTVDATPVIDASLEPSIAATPSPTTIAAGDVVLLTVTTANFELVNPNVAPPPKPGEGHYHYYVDDAVNYVAAWTPTVGVLIPSSAAPGVHMIRLVLVTSDHVEVTPTVETTVTFMVQ